MVCCRFGLLQKEIDAATIDAIVSPKDNSPDLDAQVNIWANKFYEEKMLAIQFVNKEILVVISCYYML
jgi:hypothetical protein